MGEKTPLIQPTSAILSDVERGVITKPPGLGGASIEWRNIVYEISSGGCCGGRGEPKQILKGVSGAVAAGSVCAVLGASGAGKTTLLNVLAGRVGSGGGHTITGEVLVAGQRIDPVDFRSRIAYVMQEDALLPTTTVREAIAFSARLRLPSTVSAEARAEFVEELLSSLALQRCADQYIGSQFLRGVSGGEKKRAAIGVELVASPGMLFLDEPTSGLDAYSALSAMRQLRDRARATGVAVLCTIHQPSSEVFDLFDSVIILAGGRSLYCGPRDGVTAHFAALGRPVPTHFNPADHALLTIQSATEAEVAAFVAAAPPYTPPPPCASLEQAFPPMHRRGVHIQLAALAVREWLNVVRDWRTLVFRLFVTCFMNGLIGAVYYRVGDPSRESFDVRSAFGALFQLSVGAMFGAAQPIMLAFPLERPVFLRESAAGLYLTWPYFLSKIVLEIPLAVLQNVVALLWLYFLMDLQGNFGLHLIGMSLVSVVACSIALMMGCAVTSAKRALESMPLLFIPQMLFTGVFVKISQMPSWLQWPQYLCGLKYSINIIALNEFQSYPPGSNATLEGERLLADNDMEQDNWWLYFGILVALIVGFRTIALVALSRRATSVY